MDSIKSKNELQIADTAREFMDAVKEYRLYIFEGVVETQTATNRDLWCADEGLHTVGRSAIA
jgi:hypothetical protein